VRSHGKVLLYNPTKTNSTRMATIANRKQQTATCVGPTQKTARFATKATSYKTVPAFLIVRVDMSLTITLNAKKFLLTKKIIQMIQEQTRITITMIHIKTTLIISKKMAAAVLGLLLELVLEWVFLC
jgi:hypothetical protein